MSLSVVPVLFAVLAGLLHVYIWVLETLRWTEVSTRRAFGTTEQFAESTKELAANQGFYNLFLAIEVFIGAGVLWSHPVVGTTLIGFGLASMVAASLVLVALDRRKVRAAAIQGTLPFLGLLALVLT